MKTITIKDSKAGYPGSTIINCDKIVRIYPKKFTQADKSYQSVIIVTTLGMESECYRNCYEPKDMESVIGNIVRFLNEENTGYSRNMNIPAFCPNSPKL